MLSMTRWSRRSRSLGKSSVQIRSRTSSSPSRPASVVGVFSSSSSSVLTRCSRRFRSSTYGVPVFFCSDRQIACRFTQDYLLRAYHTIQEAEHAEA